MAIRRIGTDQLAPGAVTQPKIAALAVGTGEIAAGAVTQPKIGALAVGTPEIAAGAVTNPKIGASAVGTTEIAADAVTQPKIGPSAVGTTEIAADAVTQPKIGALAVGTPELAGGAVTQPKIGALAVGTPELAGGAVTQPKIGALAVGTAEIAAGAVTNPKIGALAVDTPELAANAVDNSKLDETSNFNFTGTVQRAGVTLADENFAGPAHPWKAGVVASTIAALPAFTASGSPAGDILTANANGALTIDGLAVADNDRVLIQDETGANEKHNGLRIVTDKGAVGAPYILTRTDDMNVSAEVVLGAIIHDSRRKKFYFVNAFLGTLGTDAITFEERQEGLSAQRTEDTGTGSQRNFDLGHSESLGHEVFVGGVLQPTSIYAINAGAGAGGVDRLEFTATNEPANTEAVDVNYFTRT